MPLNLSTNEGSLVLELSGSIDINSTDSLREQIAAALGDATSVSVSANDTDYIDSSGVALLLFVKQQTEAKGAVFEFVSASAAVAKVIELAMLSAVLPISQVADAQSQDQASDEFSMDDFDDSFDDLFADEPSPNDSSKKSAKSDSGDDIFGSLDPDFK